MARIIVFGATGYTGELTAEALCARGAKPIIAGRSQAKLSAIADKLGGLETRVANVTDPCSVKDLVQEGDVLITTVGPFGRFGAAALDAAVEKGAHYVDATGEIAFARQAIDTHGPLAKERGVSIHTACGYDFVPGHCAAAVAIERARSPVSRVDVGYYASEGTKPALSGGTQASIADVMLEPGVLFEGGQLVEKAAGTKVRKFDLGRGGKPAINLSSTEHIYLPRLYPTLEEVNVYLGWFGSATYLMPVATTALAAIRRVPGVDGFLRRTVSRRVTSDGRGPDEAARKQTGSHIVAITYDAAGKELSRADLTGVHGYTFTANILALFGDWIAQGRIRGAGALDPVSAFGLEALVTACAEAGLQLKGDAP
jgi:short subunit dehydrogenase-like uncharacterized protein